MEQEIEFGQFEPLTKRIKSLIRDYPEGVGILQELIQNADDAGASRVHIVVDWRKHRVDAFPRDNMECLFGPALLAYNDSEFTEEDFRSIQRLGDSGKVEDPRKTGRFGVGFNSVYNLTDWPSFISGKFIAFFDPHLTFSSNSARPGGMFEFQQWWERYPAFMGLYVPGGMAPNTKEFSGTLFRLPLRTAEHAGRSDIKETPFERSSFEQIVRELAKVGPELLLFLKSVRKVTIEEIPARGPAQPRLLLSIATRNVWQVDSQQIGMKELLASGMPAITAGLQEEDTAATLASYVHHIDTTIRDKAESTLWRVVSLLHAGADGELLGVMEQLQRIGQKAVPWAGAAVKISEDGRPISVKGRAYCSLPTPVETGLPIHINGFFDLDSARTGLTGEKGLTGTDALRGQWNRLLIEHAVALACSHLVEALTQDLPLEIVPDFYKVWPMTPIHTAFATLPREVAKRLHERPVFRTTSETDWATPESIRLLPSYGKELLQPLALDGLSLSTHPVPEEIRRAFIQAGGALVELEPADLRRHYLHDGTLGVPLEDAPKPSLRAREWLPNLLRFCVHDGGALWNLPLALRADGQLGVFASNPDAKILLATKAQMALFPHRPDWFIDPDFAKEAKLAGVAEADELRMTPAHVAARLGQVVGSEDKRGWEPGGENPPNAHWLASVYRYFTELDDIPAQVFNQFPLVPGNDSNLHRGALYETPLLAGMDAPSALLQALKALSIPVVDGPKALMSAIHSFIEKHERTVIWTLTAPDLADTLSEITWGEVSGVSANEYDALIAYLCQGAWGQGEGVFEDKHVPLLRKLPIFPTVDGDRVALEHPRVFIPAKFEGPRWSSEAKLIQTDGIEKFIRHLKVSVLSRQHLIVDFLLPSYPGMPEGDQREALAWLRDHYLLALSETETSGLDRHQLETTIKATALIKCQDGQYRPAGEVYDPDAKVAIKVLGGTAPLPDGRCYQRSDERWKSFFRSLGMREQPTGASLLAYVDKLRVEANEGLREKTAEALVGVLTFLIEHWDSMKGETTPEGKTLPIALRDRAWLPALSDEKDVAPFPAALRPENKLYMPSELFLARHGQYVASQAPLVRAKRAVPEPLAKELRFRLEVPQDMLFAHFDEIIVLAERSRVHLKDPKYQGALQSIYRELTTRASVQPGTLTPRLTAQLLQGRFAAKPCLWDTERKVMVRPDRAYRADIGFFGRRRARVQAQDPKIDEAYALLGRKDSPQVVDYFELLKEVAEDTGKEILAPDDLKIVIKTLRSLSVQVENNGWELTGHKLYLPTEDSRFELASKVYIADAPWWSDAIDRALVNLLHEGVSAEFAKKVGSPSLADSIEEVSAEEPAVATSADCIRWCQAWKETLASAEFLKGIDRLIRHAGGAFSREEWGWLAGVKIIPASRISTDLWLGDMQVAQDLAGSSYYDQARRRIYLAEDTRRSMHRQLTICLFRLLKVEGLDIRTELGEMLLAPPHEIKRLLDELRIKASPDELVLNEQDESAEEEGDWLSLEVEGAAPVDTLDEGFAEPPEEPAQSTQPIQSQRPASPASKPAAEEAKPTVKPAQSEGRALGLRKNVEPVHDAASERAVPANAGGSTRSEDRPKEAQALQNEESSGAKWSASRPDHEGVGLRHQQGRFRTYVSSSDESGESVSLKDQAHRLRVDEGGVSCVLSFEEAAGRSPNRMAHEHPGYDVESKGKDGSIERYIEVKSISGKWGDSGVGLSSTQFEHAQRLRERYWLYVVEFACLPEARITRLQDPARLIKQFLFDSGWSRFGEPQLAHAEDEA